MDYLKFVGIRGTPNKLIESYLDRREITTKINSDISEPLRMKKGVPQGSVLGPLLYILYIQNLSTCNLYGHYAVYADDTILLYAGKDQDATTLHATNSYTRRHEIIRKLAQL